MGDGGSDEHKPRSSGLADTIPASEPPLDIDGVPMRNSRATIPPVTHERYRHGPELGRGGMGRVIEAFDTQLGRTVALKEVLPGGASIARRFIREVEITARLEHASIVPLYDSGTSVDGKPFYVMRRVTGRPLDEQIARARGLGERLTLLPAVLAAIDAIAHAHKRGIIHRDLKPANILVGELGETVVIDWGLAKVIGEDEIDEELAPLELTAADSLQTQAGSVFGTPGFMSPEQARGEPLSTRSDVYALGATLYHLLSGSPPHAGASATVVLGRTLKHDVVPLADAAPGAPPELVAIVDKALAFDADGRYANAGALGEDVRRFLAGQLVAAHRYTPRQRVARYARRHRAAIAIAALATVALAALAWFSVHRIVEERDAATEARHHSPRSQAG
ncbi:MAG: serine/threonine protein kinase, partial [Deltaproteobacteria bacterium]|nr:serine/threonine protein kinase [Deltaproteobacteria bacterium]